MSSDPLQPDNAQTPEFTIHPFIYTKIEDTGFGYGLNFIVSDEANLFWPDERYETVLMTPPANISVYCSGFYEYATLENRDIINQFIDKMEDHFSEEEQCEMFVACNNAIDPFNGIVFGRVFLQDDKENRLLNTPINPAVFYVVEPHPQTLQLPDIDHIRNYISNTYQQAFNNRVKL